MRQILTAFYLSIILVFPLGAQDTKKLQSINSQIKSIEQKLAELKTQKKSLLNDIYEIELKYEKEKIETEKVKYQLRRTREKIQAKEFAKKKLEKEIDQSKQKVKRIIRTLFKIPGNLYVILFLKVDSSDQIFKNYGLFSALVKYQSAEIDKIKNNISRLQEIKDDLQSQYNQLSVFTRAKEARLKNIGGLKQQKLSYIRKINGDRQHSLKLLAELKDEAERLTAILENKQFISRYVRINLQQIKGRLIWPVEGKVVSTFGRKKSTQFDTYVFNNGIEIEPSGSESIKAVYDGDVVFSEYFKGYGNLMIVQHSKDFMSLYGHCESFLKQKGDRVKKGDYIAIVGSSGSTSGKSLYFEIRQKLKAQNPLQWLSKR